MRIPNHYATQKSVASFATVRAELDAALSRVTSGRRFTAASDDPTSALVVMQNDAHDRAITQYRRNIETANARLSLEDGVLDALSSLLTRAKELAMSQGSDTSNLASRQATTAEANQLVAQAVQLAGTKYDGEYLFGGARSTTAPYALDATGAVYTVTAAVPAPAGARRAEVAPGQLAAGSHDGAEVFGDATTGPLSALQALAAALNSGDVAAITAAIPSIDAAMAATQVRVAEVGARVNQLTSVDATHTALSVELSVQTSNARDLDLETAMTELVARQLAFQAAMAATARVSGLSLTDYI